MVIVLLFDMPQPDPAHNGISLWHAPQGEHGHQPEGHGGNSGYGGHAAHAHQKGNERGCHNRLTFRAQDMRVAVQGLVDRQGTVHITAPEKENTELTMLAAKAMNEMPKTTDKRSLKPPLISSLFRAAESQ